MSLERPLRLLTYLATAITLPLTIAATVVSLNHQGERWAPRHVTAFCFVFIPLALTVVTSSITLQYTRKHGKSPSTLGFKLLDLVSALAYLAVLVPCWTVEIEEFSAGGFGLLVGYTTAPMILNMFIHIYFTLNAVPYKKLLSTVVSKRSSSCKECAHCQAKCASATTETTTKKGYSLLRGEDYLEVEADHVEYRDSEDFLGEGAGQVKQADTPEASGKNKDMLEV